MKTKYEISGLNRGSLTAEASVIVPLILMITAALLTLTFFKANVNFYFAGACETALVGNERSADATEKKTAQHKAEKRAEERISGQIFPGSSPEVSVTCSAGETKVVFSGQRFALFPEDWFDYSIDVHIDRIRPADGLRYARAAGRLLQSSDN